MLPRFPIYIPSKSRADSRLTMKALDELGVFYRVVVEPQQYADYAKVLDKKQLLVLDMEYIKAYDVQDDLGLTKSVGPGAARNFIWDHSISEGYEWHWVMDDNIRNFYRLNRNRRIPVGDGACFALMEEFVLRYTNVAMAGPSYFMFTPKRNKNNPIIMNTRIYSCNLIRNDTPYRWRCRYNEDTDLSLRMLKDGWCTIQFNAFLQNKTATQQLGGGNTEAFYAAEGTLPKSKMLVKAHPDVARLVHKWGRWHHQVDYSVFKSNILVRKPGLDIPSGIDEHGIRLIKLDTPKPLGK